MPVKLRRIPSGAPGESRNQQRIESISTVQTQDVFALLDQARQKVVKQPRRFPVTVKYRQA